MRLGLIGKERTKPSGIIHSDDNVIIQKKHDDITNYKNNANINIPIPLPTGIQDLYIKPDNSKIYFIDANRDIIQEYNFSEDNITPQYFNLKNFSPRNQDTAPQGIFFKPDGTKVYVIGGTNRVIYQYSLGTAWDTSTATYDNKSFSVNTQETAPRDLFIKDDGTKVYIVGQTADTIFQYTLATPWDISTASYDSKSFSILAQDTNSTGLFFKPDGTKVYMVGTTSGRIYQYSLSVAWDISTASYDTKSLLLTSQESAPTGIFFKDDGTKLYIIGTNSDSIFQYSLNTPWDISTGFYDTRFFYVSALEATSTGLFFKPDGTEVYIIGTSTILVQEFSLSVPWQMGEVDVIPSYFISHFEPASTGLTFKPDGTFVYFTGTTNQRIWQLQLTTPWNTKTALRISSSLVTITQDTEMRDLFFKPDGTKLYTIGQTADAIFQYTLTTAWDTTTAYYEGKSFSIASQELTSEGLFFKDDGTKVYIIGTTNDRIYQYSLGTAWDISTASYDNKSFLISAQEGTSSGLFFKPDGTKVYIIGGTSDRIYQYSLSVAWDISTASYDSKSFSILAQDTTSEGLFFKDDGTKVYMLGSSTDAIFQYTLATPWDISTASYDSKSLSVAFYDGTSRGLFFKSDGTKVYFTGSNDRVFELPLTTAWDISTSIRSFSVGTQDTAPQTICFKSDGTKVYMLGNTSDTVYQYSLSTAWDISTASYDNKSFYVGVYDTNPSGMYFDSDGKRLYIVGLTGDYIFSFTLATPWDISTVQIQPYYSFKSFSILAQDAVSGGLFFKPDGTKIYMVGQANDRIYQYALTTAWDISTTSYENKSFSIASQEINANAMFIKDDGTKVYIVGSTNDTIYQYSMVTPWDISTASYDSKSFSILAQDTTSVGLFFKPDGTKLYMTGITADSIFQYTLATPWDISTTSYDGKLYSYATQEGSPQDLFFKSDGTRVYIVGQTRRIYQYELRTAWDITTAYYSNKSIPVDEGLPSGLFFKPDGTKFYTVGNTNDAIYEYECEIPWDITRNIKKIYIGEQDINATGIALNSDLSKLYMVGFTNSNLTRYDFEV